MIFPDPRGLGKKEVTLDLQGPKFDDIQLDSGLPASSSNPLDCLFVVESWA